MTTCSQCINYRKRSPEYGRCVHYRNHMAGRWDAESCRHALIPSGLQWTLDDCGDWFLYRNDEYLGIVAQNNQRTEWGLFCGADAPGVTGTLADCARALVERVKGCDPNG